MPRAGSHFTAWQDATIIRMKEEEGKSDPEIAKALGRSRGVIVNRIHRLRLNGKMSPGKPTWHQPNQEAMAEARRAYAHEQSLSARICGDPLPGRSALDRRTSGR